MTVPPPPPLSGWLFLATLVATAVYLYVRAARHRHRLITRLGIAIGAFFGFALPTLAVTLAQDLTCRDGGVLPRPDGGLIVVGLTATTLLLAFWLSWLAGDRPTGTGWRLVVVALVLLIPVAIVEVMAATVPLEDYCEGLRGLLVTQAVLALAVPLAALAIGGWKGPLPPASPPPPWFRVPMTAVVASVVVLAPVQTIILVDRLRPDPLVCTNSRPLAATERDAVGIRGNDTYLNLTTGDFDGDGLVDLAGADESGTIHVLHHEGRGGFTAGAEAVPAPTLSPGGLMVAGDLDGDGHEDLVVSGQPVVVEPTVDRSRHSGVAVLMGDGKGLHAHGPLFLDGGSPPRDLALGDIDGDGNAEAVVLDGGIVVVLWDRDGELEEGPRLAAPAEATSQLGQSRMALGDVDGDGRTDIFTWLHLDSVPSTGVIMYRSVVILHRNTGSGTFATSVLATIDGSLGGVAVADFDGDGDVDLVAQQSERRQRRLHVLVNRGDGRFDVGTQPSRVDGRLVAADVNGDGRPDLVISAEFDSEGSKYPGDLLIRLNLGDLRFSEAQRLARPRVLLAVADLNGDRRADYVVDSIREIVVLASRDCAGQ